MFDKRRQINEPEDIGRRINRLDLYPSTDTSDPIDANELTLVAQQSVFPPFSRVPTPDWGRRIISGHYMISTQPPKAIVLASSLFCEVSGITCVPNDGVYADCLIALAFGHLRAALAEQIADAAELKICADAVEGCKWLSEAVRAHVSRTLRDASEGRVPLRLAADIVVGASNRTAHQMVIDCVRSAGSDGLAFLADTVSTLALEGARK